MANGSDKTGRESGKSKASASGKGPTGSPSAASSSTATGGTRGTKGEKGEQAPKSENTAAGSQASGSTSVADYQAERRRELEAVLAKRSEESANAPAIVKEFAALWLPHHLVEAEVLVPALEEAGADEDKSAAVRVRKDILNLLLADLVRNGAPEHAQAKLEAMSDALDAVMEAVEEERESAGEEMDGDGAGSQMKARYERIKQRFEDLDESIGDAMALLAPRILSIPPVPQPGRRDSGMTRQAMRGRGEQGRYLSEGDRESPRRPWSGEREEYEGGGRRSGSRYDDEEDERLYGRESMSRGRGEDERYEDERYRGRSEGRGHGGWYGDREGHSQASRRGRHSRGRYEDKEDDRHGRRAEGHGHGGWYGDPEGHSEASRRGWEEREGSYRGRTRYEDEDDDRRYQGRRGAGYDDEDEGRGSRGSGGGSERYRD